MVQFKKTLTVFVAALFAAVLFSSPASGVLSFGYTGDYDEPIGLTDEGAKGTKLSGVVYLELYDGYSCFTGSFPEEVTKDDACGPVLTSDSGVSDRDRFARVVLRLRHGKEFHILYMGGIYIVDAADPTLITPTVIGEMETAVLEAFEMTGSIVIKDLDEFGRVNANPIGSDENGIPLGSEIVLSDIVLIVQD